METINHKLTVRSPHAAFLAVSHLRRGPVGQPGAHAGHSVRVQRVTGSDVGGVAEGLPEGLVDPERHDELQDEGSEKEAEHDGVYDVPQGVEVVLGAGLPDLLHLLPDQTCRGINGSMER